MKNHFELFSYLQHCVQIKTQLSASLHTLRSGNAKGYFSISFQIYMIHNDYEASYVHANHPELDSKEK